MGLPSFKISKKRMKMNGFKNLQNKKDENEWVQKSPKKKDENAWVQKSPKKKDENE